MKRWMASTILLVLLCGPMARADVQLPGILSSNMVLQRNQPIVIWGQADPQQTVTVEMAGQSATVVADQQGRWSLQLDAMEAGGPYVMTVEGNNRIELTNVLVGDVWLCAGQSNMQRSMTLSEAGRDEIAHADRPRIRLLTPDRVPADQPVADVQLVQAWTPCSPQSVSGFSAVAYYFGATLEDELDIPIGLINCSWGGTRAEAWTSEPALRAVPALKTVYDRAGKIQASANLEPQRQHLPARIFNSLIAPLTRHPIAGVIWYQGESNEPWPNEYRTLLPTLIADWRAQWDRPNLPFGIVQLTAYRQPQSKPAEDSRWAMIRQVQLDVSRSVPHTGLAITTDIGDQNNIHPANKRDVGYRLALWALADVYGFPYLAGSPIFRDMSIAGDKVTLTFDQVGGGLVVRGGGELRGFAVAGADRKFVWARAVLDGNRITLSGEGVRKPVAVRYGWADNPRGNLFSVNGLPASPFRTDDWPTCEDAR